MGTLQENQSLNAEYERNKKERILQERLEEYQKYVDINHKEIERLHSIIKEVREYVEEWNTNYYYNSRQDDKKCLEELLDILDKENK